MCNTRLFQWAGCVLLLQSTQLQAAESILWRNSATGQNQLSLYQTLAESAATPLNQVSDPQWQVATSGDFNGDGDDDLLWRHQSSGANHLYLMQQGKITSQHPLNTVADLNWSVAGSGDFNGDGKDDLLWRNQVTGLNWLYFLNGTTIEHQARLNQIADPQWQVAAIADLDADHKADIIWRHKTTEQNYLYLMDGNRIKAQRYLNTVPTDAWQLSAAQDFDGDGSIAAVLHQDNSNVTHDSQVVTQLYFQASGDTQIIDKEAPGFAYHPGTDSAIAWFGGETVYQLNLDTWHWQAKTAASDNQTIPAQGVSRGTFGRFRYVPDYDVFILVNDVRQNVLFYKL